MSAQNPYAPPLAAVTDHAEPEQGPGAYVAGGRSVGAGHGWRWYKAAWRIFKVQPLRWWVSLVTMMVFFAAAGQVPYAGLLTNLLGPLLYAGIASCAATVLSGQRFAFKQMFDGCRRNTVQLLLIGMVWLVLYGGLLLLLGRLFGMTGLLGLLIGGSAAQTAMAGAGAGFFIIYSGAVLVAFAAYTFAPYLVFEQGLSAIDAMKTSFFACFRNFGAGIVAMLSGLLWGLVATLPVGLGWLVFIPVLMLTFYAAYRDIFYE